MRMITKSAVFRDRFYIDLDLFRFDIGQKPESCMQHSACVFLNIFYPNPVPAFKSYYFINR